MQERGRISSMDLQVYLGELKKNPKFTEEMLQLVEEDLKFGLTPKETEQYTSRKLDYIQMKAVSQCLRNGYSGEVIETITDEGLMGEQMAVALEFYEKGVPLPLIKEITENAEQTAFTMKKLFQDILEKADHAEETAKQEETYESYAKELVEQVKEAVGKIEFQEKRYDALNEKLKELKTAGQDARVQEHLLAQISEKEQLLEKQQEEINEARIAIARLRNEQDRMEKEHKELEKRREKNKQERKEKEQKTEETETKAVQKLSAAFGSEISGDSKKISQPEQEINEKEQEKEGQERVSSPVLPTEYQAAILDSEGNVIRMVPVECEKKPKKQGRWTAFFSLFHFKKKLDIVRLVAEKKLETGQLIQIRNAIEKGLTESQLLVLINHSAPAEQMEEIIKIAVYENKQRGGLSWD